MPTPLRVYLDTSVISAMVDSRDPFRRRLTEQFWLGMPSHEPHVSRLVLQEIGATPDEMIRRAMLALAAPLAVLEQTAESEQITSEYITRGVFSTAMISDARHVAIAVASKVPIVVSWNYRHLVNRERRLRVNRVNADLGMAEIEIVAPPELART